MADSPIVTRKSERMKDREAELAKIMGVKKTDSWLSAQTKNDLLRLAMAGLSSTIAQFFVHGVETVKVRMQVEGNAARLSGLPMKYSNVYTGAVYVYQNEGIAGLYKVGRSDETSTATHEHARRNPPDCGAKSPLVPVHNLLAQNGGQGRVASDLGWLFALAKRVTDCRQYVSSHLLPR